MKAKAIQFLVAVTIVITALMGFTYPAVYSRQTQVQVEADLTCNYGQCNATAKSTGNRCKHCVSNSGDLYCWQHD